MRSQGPAMGEDLSEQITLIAQEAVRDATGPAAAEHLAEILARLRGPLRLAIAGKVKAGKSTLLNALIGEQLAPTDAGECTRIVTWYVYSDRPYSRLVPIGGVPIERPYDRRDGALSVDLGEYHVDSVERLEVGWPSSRLRDLVLIDTPGIASISTEASARTHRVMEASDGRVPIADAVLYLLRHTHSSDLRFLEAFHDDAVSQGTPVNTVGVLSRADEIGSARLDAMEVAERVAHRYQEEPRLHRLCPLVIPVNGLLGHAAATLREDEFVDLATVARASPDQMADLLLTADRFVHYDTPVPLATDRRLALLDRLGLFGVRLSVELISTGAISSSPALASHLAEVSGLDRLRGVVLRQFDARARVLKARSAVGALREAFHRGACVNASGLQLRLEEVTANAHEFEEVRVLLALRSGELDLGEDEATALDLLMGGAGHDPSVRLGLRPEASPEQAREAALAALGRWQEVERHPLSTRPTQLAARAAARTVEGLLAG